MSKLENLGNNSDNRTKHMAIQRNYGEQEVEITESEDKNEDLMEEGQNSSFPSKVSDTSETQNINPNSRKSENVEE